MEATYSSETLVGFQRLHCSISKKIELYITIAVRASNGMHVTTDSHIPWYLTFEVEKVIKYARNARLFGSQRA
jgi:hypothetical protein